MTPAYTGPAPWPRLYKDNTMYTPPPETFMLSYRGSLSHGTFIPAAQEGVDDIDLMGFVFGPREHYLGLSDWGSRGTKEVKEGAYDVVLYEIKKAFRLLLGGNPNILSMLWTKPQHVLLETPAAKELIANRDIFVGKHIYNAFAGYAATQAKKMESRDPAELREYLAVTAELKYRGRHPNHRGEVTPAGKRESGEAVDCMAWSTDKLLARLAHYQKKGENLGYMGEKRKQLVLEHSFDSKNAAHLIRLLRMAVEFLKTGELQVHRPDAQELIDIKKGKWPLEQIKLHAEELFAQAKEARDSSTLSEQPDRHRAERLLMRLIEQRLWEVA